MNVSELPEGEVYTIGQKKFVVSYFRDAENNLVKSTKEYDLIKTKTTLPKSVVERRKWNKFGVSKGLPEGPDKASTNIVYDEVFFEFNNKNKVKDDSVESNSLTNITKKQLKCRHCGGAHWSVKCTNKDLINNLKKNSIEEKEKLKEKSGKYIPKFKREGLDVNKKRSKENTIRVSNITTNATNEDIRDLFNSFGRIKSLYYTGKGFAFITFDSLRACEEAVEKVNKHPYDYLILSVEISK